MGGKCSKCGYNECIASLSFHHKNPYEKEGSSDWMKGDFNPDKWELLCLNCHSEFHYHNRKPKHL